MSRASPHASVGRKGGGRKGGGRRAGGRAGGGGGGGGGMGCVEEGMGDGILAVVYLTGYRVEELILQLNFVYYLYYDTTLDAFF